MESNYKKTLSKKLWLDVPDFASSIFEQAILLCGPFSPARDMQALLVLNSFLQASQINFLTEEFYI
jgi:hypothetical protein